MIIVIALSIFLNRILQLLREKEKCALIFFSLKLNELFNYLFIISLNLPTKKPIFYISRFFYDPILITLCQVSVFDKSYISIQ